MNWTVFTTTTYGELWQGGREEGRESGREEVTWIHSACNTLTRHLPPSSCRSLPDGKSFPMKIRSMVGLIPLYACLVLEDDVIKKLPGFRKRLQWFMNNRQDIAKQVWPSANVSPP